MKGKYVNTNYPVQSHITKVTRYWHCRYCFINEVMSDLPHTVEYSFELIISLENRLNNSSIVFPLSYCPDSNQALLTRLHRLVEIT